MNFIQTFKNYLFSSNWSLTNPNYRFSSIFYQRFFIDFFLRIFIFLPFGIFIGALIYNGGFKDIAEIMFQSGQNLYGYLLVSFIYIPIFLFLVMSLIVSLFGSVLKRNIFKMDNEDGDISVLPKNYKQAFFHSWKNLWYMTVETFVFLLLSKFIIEFYANHAISLSLLILIKFLFSSILTSCVLALLLSLFWIHSSNTDEEKEIESD